MTDARPGSSASVADDAAGSRGGAPTLALESDIALLADVANAWLAMPSEKDVFAHLGDGLRQVIGDDAIISVSNYEPRSRRYKPQVLLGLGPLADKLSGLIGKRPIDLAADYPPAVKLAMTSGRLSRVEGGVLALAGDIIPALILRQVAAIIGLQEVYVVGFAKGEFAGGICIVTKRPGVELRRPTIEALARMAAVAIERTRAEESARRAEEAALQLNSLLQKTFDAIPDLLTVHDRDLRVVLSNWHGRNHVTQEERDSKPHCYACYTRREQPCEPCPAMDVFRTGAAVTTEVANPFTGKLLEVSAYPVTDAAGAVVLVTEHVRDITERRRLEEQLRASQKMEAIGGLAGGVAHDFNNLLSVILIYTGLAIDAAQDGGPQKDDLLEVRNAAKRAETLTRRLLAFGRRQVLQPVPLNLNETAAGLEKMLRRILGEDIEFVQVLAPDLGIVHADPGQLEQVLMNLVVNARDAMPDGGKLTIETSNVQIDEERAAVRVGLPPGPYVVLAVTDTGTGMDEQTKARLFEPFFTTKPKGKGTGLGLSMVYGIVKQSGGNISVSSEPGHGTTFKIQLPRDLSATAAPAARRTPSPRRTTGTETVLVVEDEDALRRVAVRSLAAAGYTVLSAAGGDEALAVCERRAVAIELLLTDVVMPGMSGSALAQALLQTRPTLKVVYMSGYTDDTIVHRGVLDAGTHFLAKPFTAADLTRKVREVLDGDTPASPDDRHEVEAQADAEVEEPPLGRAALAALSAEVRGDLCKAVIAARYDEIVKLVETIRATQPAVADGLRRMADQFDYQGMRELLGLSVERGTI